jgi:hypothetical protein
MLLLQIVLVPKGAALMSHLEAFLDAMHRRDIEAAKPHIADNIVVRNPLYPEPMVGKDKMLSVLSYLLGIADKYDVVDLLRSESHFAVLHHFKFGEVEVDGVDYLHVNNAGLVDSLTVLWRPLAALVALQSRLAPLLGVPPLKLVTA